MTKIITQIVRDCDRCENCEFSKEKPIVEANDTGLECYLDPTRPLRRKLTELCNIYRRDRLDWEND